MGGVARLFGGCAALDQSAGRPSSTRRGGVARGRRSGGGPAPPRGAAGGAGRADGRRHGERRRIGPTAGRDRPRHPASDPAPRDRSARRLRAGGGGRERQAPRGVARARRGHSRPLSGLVARGDGGRLAGDAQRGPALLAPWSDRGHGALARGGGRSGRDLADAGRSERRARSRAAAARERGHAGDLHLRPAAHLAPTARAMGPRRALPLAAGRPSRHARRAPRRVAPRDRAAARSAGYAPLRCGSPARPAAPAVAGGRRAGGSAGAFAARVRGSAGRRDRRRFPRRRRGRPGGCAATPRGSAGGRAFRRRRRRRDDLAPQRGRRVPARLPSSRARRGNPAAARPEEGIRSPRHPEPGETAPVTVRDDLAAAGATLVEDGEGIRVTPSSVASLARAVAVVRAHRVALRLRGSGDAPVNAPPSGVLLDLGSLDRIATVNSATGIARVEAGCSVAALESAVRRAGCTLGPLLPSVRAGSVGAWLAGPTRRARGVAGARRETAALSLAAILPDGRIAEGRAAPTKAVGPDLAHLSLRGGGRPRRGA